MSNGTFYLTKTLPNVDVKLDLHQTLGLFTHEIIKCSSTVNLNLSTITTLGWVLNIKIEPVGKPHFLSKIQFMNFIRTEFNQAKIFYGIYQNDFYIEMEHTKPGYWMSKCNSPTFHLIRETDESYIELELSDFRIQFVENFV